MWLFKGEEIRSIDQVPEGAVGFIYLMTCLETGKKYIGKKLLYSQRKVYLTKKEVALLENKRLKKWKTVVKESNWLDYTSSSKEVNDDLKKGQLFKMEILQWTFSKVQTTYLEIKLQFINEVLESDDWYNGNINHRWFRGNIGFNEQDNESIA